MYDPTLKPGVMSYNPEYMAEVGGAPFIEVEDMPGVYACPVCGVLRLDITGEFGSEEEEEKPATKPVATKPAGK